MNTRLKARHSIALRIQKFDGHEDPGFEGNSFCGGRVPDAIRRAYAYIHTMMSENMHFFTTSERTGKDQTLVVIFPGWFANMICASYVYTLIV
jgi:hypothetical protein